MDKNHSITIPAELKSGQHLGTEERKASQQLRNLDYSNRAIARVLHYSPSTVGQKPYPEIRRSTLGTEQVRSHKCSLDACVGYARLNSLFPAEKIFCTKTLYNLLWKG